MTQKNYFIWLILYDWIRNIIMGVQASARVNNHKQDAVDLDLNPL